MKNLIVHLNEESAWEYRFEDSDVETAIRVTTSLIERIATVDTIRPLCVIKIQHRVGTFMSRELFIEALRKLTNFETVIVKLSHYKPGNDNFTIYANVGPSSSDRVDVGYLNPRYAKLKQSLAATLGHSVRIHNQHGWCCMTFRPRAFVKGA